MDLLLDTRVFLWWDVGANPISPSVRAVIADSKGVAQMWARP